MVAEERQLDGPEISVRLMGRVAEAATLASGQRTLQHEVRFRLPRREAITLREIIHEIAQQNPLLASQIVRKDGNPRSSTKVLVNGQPPDDLDMKFRMEELEMDEPLPDGARAMARRRVVVVLIDVNGDRRPDIVIVVVMPCDG